MELLKFYNTKELRKCALSEIENLLDNTIIKHISVEDRNTDPFDSTNKGLDETLKRLFIFNVRTIQMYAKGFDSKGNQEIETRKVNILRSCNQFMKNYTFKPW